MAASGFSKQQLFYRTSDFTALVSPLVQVHEAGFPLLKLPFDGIHIH